MSKDGNIIKRFAVSSFVVSLGVLIICSILFAYHLATLRDNVARLDALLLETVSTEIDLKLEDLGQITTIISTSNANNRLKRLEEPLAVPDAEVLEYQNLIRNLRLSKAVSRTSSSGILDLSLSWDPVAVSPTIHISP